jgi:MFS family permease
VSQASWFASITAFFSPLGGLLSGYMLDKFGRRMTLISINVISIASWLIIGFSSRSDVDALFLQLMLARIIIGEWVSEGADASMPPGGEAENPIIHHHHKNQTKLIIHIVP